jgi:lipoprotein-releasing system permease protein
MSFAWDLFRHYLLSRRAGSLIRTVAWISIAGVAIGVMALVVVISVMSGFDSQIRNRLLAVEPHLVATMPLSSAPNGTMSSDQIGVSPDYLKLRAQPHVQTDLFENQDVIIRTVDGNFGGAVARGVESQTLKYILNETRKESLPKDPASSTFIEPAPIAKESTDLEKGEVMIGIDLARSLGIFEGDTVTLIAPEALLLPSGEAPPFERVVVKSLITTNIADIDEKVLYYGRGRSLLTFLNSPSRVSGFEVRLPKPEEFQDIKSALEKNGWKVESWIDRNSSLFYALKMEKFAMGVFLGLAGLVASFSIVTVLVLLLTQKRKDIGLLMGLGLSPKRTQNLFIQVGLILSAIGIGTGLTAGVVISLLLDRFPIPLLPEVYYDATIPATVSPMFVFGIFIVATLIAFISAYIPARQTTRESPAEALRGSILAGGDD